MILGRLLLLVGWTMFVLGTDLPFLELVGIWFMICSFGILIESRNV